MTVYAVYSEQGQFIVAYRMRLRAYEFCKNLVNPMIRKMKMEAISETQD